MTYWIYLLLIAIIAGGFTGGELPMSALLNTLCTGLVGETLFLTDHRISGSHECLAMSNGLLLITDGKFGKNRRYSCGYFFGKYKR